MTTPASSFEMQNNWKASVLSLFPEAFPGVLGISVIGKALKDKKWVLETIDIRDFSCDKHKSVDTPPLGGGPGMVLRADVCSRAIDFVERIHAGKKRPLVYLTPRGRPLTQAKIRELAAGTGVVVFCGRFEGLDERLIAARQMEEISLGDFVLAGAEIAAQALIEACIRLRPNVLGERTSIDEESFEENLLEYPQYTRPSVWKDGDKQYSVPDILLSGHHGEIAKWRRTQAEEITHTRRPDLWKTYRKTQKEANKTNKANK